MENKRVWDDMSLEEWKLWAKILKKYMPQVRMLDSVIQYMNDFERKPTSNQSTTLQRLWNTSSGKKKWEEYVTQQETLDLSRQMTNKFKSQSQSKHVNHVPAEIRRYGDG